MNLRLQLHQSQRRLKHNLNLKMEEKMEEKKVIKVFILFIRYDIQSIWSSFYKYKKLLHFYPFSPSFFKSSPL